MKWLFPAAAIAFLMSIMRKKPVIKGPDEPIRLPELTPMGLEEWFGEKMPKIEINKEITKMSKWQIPERGRPYQNALEVAEQKYNLPHNLLARVAHQESRFRPDIITGKTVSSAGAQGIMQIVPRWHPQVNPLEPMEAIDYAGQYLKNLHRQFGEWKKALAAYNWGPGNLQKAIARHGDEWINNLPRETTNYVAQISEDVPIA